MTRFKELRKQQNLSQAELAKAINVDQTAVSKWELGKSFPDMAIAIKVADFFECSVDYLLGRTDDPSPSPKNDENLINGLYLSLAQSAQESRLNEKDVQMVKDIIERMNRNE